MWVARVRRKTKRSGWRGPIRCASPTIQTRVPKAEARRETFRAFIERLSSGFRQCERRMSLSYKPPTIAPIVNVARTA